MSHSVNITTQFKNIKNLLNQFDKNGWKIQTDTKCNTYPSDPRRDEIHKYVAKNPTPNGYDVGIGLDKDGNAYFVCDFYDTSIEKQLGVQMKNIKQGYSLDALKEVLSDEDLEYRVDELPTGELVVTAEK
jgi:hypothetical protein